MEQRLLLHYAVEFAKQASKNGSRIVAIEIKRGKGQLRCAWFE